MDRYTQIVNDYLSGKMSEKQKADFLKEAENNVLLRKELKLQEDLRDTIIDEGFINLRNALKQRPPEKKKLPLYFSFYQKTSSNYIIAAAASLALLLASGMLFIFLNGQIVAPEQIAQKYYSPANAIQHIRSVERSDLTGTKEAFSYYNNGQYVQALEYFQKVKNEVISSFYSGNCYYELDDFTNAEVSFEYVIEDYNNMFIEQAEWYIALTCLKLNEVQKAKKYFGQIAESESPFAARSKKILKKLD